MTSERAGGSGANEIAIALGWRDRRRRYPAVLDREVRDGVDFRQGGIMGDVLLRLRGVEIGQAEIGRIAHARLPFIECNGSNQPTASVTTSGKPRPAVALICWMPRSSVATGAPKSAISSPAA